LDKAFTLWYKSTISNKDLERLFDAGYTTAEISIDYPWPYTTDFYEVINNIIEYGFQIQIHHPWRDINIISPYKSIRESSLQVIKEVTSQLFKKYEIKASIVHLDTRNLLSFHEIKTITNHLKELAEIQDEYMVPILIETLPNPITGSPETIKELSDILGLGICYDATHILSRELLKRKPTTETSLQIINEWVETLKEKIRLLHLHGMKIENKHVTVHLTLEDQIHIFSQLIKKVQNYNESIGITIEVFYKQNGQPVTIEDMVEQLKLLHKYL